MLRYALLTGLLITASMFGRARLYAANQTSVQRSLTVTGNKYALLIGIDLYENIDGLSGCKNDLELARNVLIKSLSFQDVNIRVLTDDSATRAAILKEISILAGKVRKGDVVFIHYSGHGGEVKPLNKNYEDSEQFLMPYDFDLNSGSPFRGILDDELYYLLGTIAHKSENLTVVLDACHSGGATKSPFMGKARRVKVRDRHISIIDSLKARYPSQELNELPYTLFTGCRAEELSSEFCAPNGAVHGLMSYALYRELEQATGKVANSDLLRRVRNKVYLHEPSNQQSPQLFGKYKRGYLLTTNQIDPFSYSYVTHRLPSERVSINLGAMQQMTVGTRFDVYRSLATDKNLSNLVGAIEVEQVKGVISICKILSGGDQIKEGGKIVLTRYSFANRKLAIQFVGFVDQNPLDVSYREAMGKRISHFANTQRRQVDAEVIVRAEGALVAVTTKYNGRPKRMPRDKLPQHLLQQSKWFNLLNADGTNAERLPLSLRVVRDGTLSTTRERIPTFKQYEDLNLEITNHSPRALKYAVVSFTDDGKFEIFQQSVLKTGNTPIPPGQTRSVKFHSELLPRTVENIEFAMVVVSEDPQFDFSLEEYRRSRDMNTLMSQNSTAPKDYLWAAKVICYKIQK